MIIAFIEAPCFGEREHIRISALKTPHSNVVDILSELRQSGEYVPRSALSLFSSTYQRLPRIISTFRTAGLNAKVFFVAPIGLLSDNDLAIPYEECFAELSSEVIASLLNKFGAITKIYDLLEANFDLSIFCLRAKILRAIEADYYIPTGRPAIIVSDSYFGGKENIYVITPNHFICSRLRKLYGKVTLYDLYQHILEYVARGLSRLLESGYSARALFGDPAKLFGALFSPSMMDDLLRISPRQDRLVRFLF